MLLYRNSKGIIHLIPLLLGLAVILGLGAVYYSAQPRTSSQQSFNLYRELMGEDGQVAGYDAVIPTSQITAIPKGECDIFVSPNGTGTGSSESSAMKSIEDAVAKAQPGQAVCLKGGEYRQVVRISKKATASAPIKIGGYTGGGLPMVSGGVNKGDQYKLPNAQCPILDSGCTRPNNGQECKRPSCQYDSLFTVNESSHLKFIGFDVRGSSGRGFVIGSNVTDVSIDGLRAYHNWSIGFQVRAEKPNYSTKRLDINRVAIYDNIRGMAENNIVGGGGGQILTVEDVTFRNSAVFRNFGEGLNVGKGAKRVVVSDSLFWENAHTALYANGAIESAFDRNFLFCTGDKEAWLKAAPNAAVGHDVTMGAAITLRNENGVTGAFGTGTGTIASNNTIVGCTTNITVAAQNKTTLSDVIVANNTMISPRKPGEANQAGITFGGSLSNILIVNNVVAGGYIKSYSSGVNYVNNIASHGSARNGIRILNPSTTKLVGLTERLEPANMNPANYVIAAGSPAVGAGTKPAARGFVEKDMFNNSRGNNPIDLGSYELGGAKSWPDVYGILFAGAPLPPEDDDDPPADRDNDGVPDSEDECPNVPAQTPNGCPEVEDDPDTDNDGLPDSEDECPNVPAQTPNGCPAEDDEEPDPDTDGDGLPDNIDECPSEPAETSTGCPTEEDDEEDEEKPIGKNLIKNGGFNARAATSSSVANWSVSKGVGGNVILKTQYLTPRGLSRGKALKITVTKYPQIGPVNLYQGDIDLDPNKKYEVSFVAKSNKNASMNFNFTDAGLLKQKIAAMVPFSIGTGWKSYVKTVQTASYSPTAKVRLSIIFRVPNGTIINVDSITIKELGN